MELITPGLGLIFWMAISFGLVLLVLRKYAWRPILGAIRARERTIARSLINAKRMEEEMQHLEEVKRQRLAEAENLHHQMVERARQEAGDLLIRAGKEARKEAARILGEAEKAVEAQKRLAMMEVRDQIASLSLDMAQQVLQEEFSDRERNERFVGELLDRMILN